MESTNQSTKPLVKPIDRSGYEDAFINLMSNHKYVNQSFYSFIIAKMKVSINYSVPTAGAGFSNGNYQLIVNPDFFNPLPLEQRIGILVHETLHVILKHIFRKGERDHKLFNVAADMALNQSIPRNMLPEGAIYPNSFKLPDGNFYPENQTSEQYYDLLKEEKENQEQEKKEQEQENGENDQKEDCSECGGSGEQEDGEGGQEQCEHCKGTGKEPGEGEGGESEAGAGQGSGYQPSNGNPDLTGEEEITIDTHELWDKMNPEDEELASQMMEGMIENAMSKTKGDLPGDLETILSLWKRAPIISWKKILKKIVSSKTGARIGTIKRRDRRQPSRSELKGRKVSYDQPNIIVGLDTSGSMSDEEIVNGLVEINEVCKLTHSTMEIVQIDTKIQGSEEYDPKKKNFMRKGCGGTYMGAMAQYITKNKVKYDALVMISDMYIEDVSTDENWAKMKKPTLWLNTSGTTVDWEGLKKHIILPIDKA